MLAVAQIRPEVGPVERNLNRHVALIELAIARDADLVVFPELSLTGYEPQRAADFARSSNDPCFSKFQLLANENRLTIGVGVPIRTARLPNISMLVFRPDSEMLVYTKQFLHPDEEPYFETGTVSPKLIVESTPISLAICYEISVVQHARQAKTSGATVYIASVAKTESGMKNAHTRLSQIALENRMIVMVSNCLGLMDNSECVGRSGVWDATGRLLAELGSSGEGIVLFDLNTQESGVVELPKIRQ